MTGLSVLDVGAISTAPYEFKPTVAAVSNVKGFREATFVGVLELTLCHQLSELVSNPGARTTIGGVTGVLEYVTVGAAAVADITGYYLLQSFDMTPDGVDESWPYAAFTLEATYIGDLA